MKSLKFSIICFLLVACDTNDDTVVSNLTLSSYLANKQIETGAVIACAASEESTNTILTFFYPVTGATNIRFYAAESSEIDKLEYSKYILKNIESTPFFNGYLRRFETENISEHWIIVTYELYGEIKISNPIRTKHITKPTIWNAAITVSQEATLMPEFSWDANAVGENAIYFQVISNSNNDLVSGTYTHENMFQFYNLSNVVLNISKGLPRLENNTNYNFTLMDVSLDNWVNIVSQKPFETL